MDTIKIAGTLYIIMKEDELETIISDSQENGFNKCYSQYKLYED